ncbi:replication initiation protein [Acinetobacter venetianus]|uniref:replication initiation protein n=1 Tax=Acinetobacter venetianus TaxID=52133 RepID=UPI003A8C9B94
MRQEEAESTEFGVIHRHVKKNALVVTHNDLAHASYSNDPNQEKLMYAAMIVIRKLELESNNVFNPNDQIQITAKNFGEITHSISLKKDELKQELTEQELIQIEQTAAKALHRIYNKFQPMIMKVKVPGSSVPAKVPMITYCWYDKDSKSIFIRFAPEFYKYFYRLIVDKGEKNLGFYSHELKQITQMESYYSIRIYRMLMETKWKGNVLEKSIDELKWSLDCVEKYKTIDNFKRRVINPAIDEINELTNLNIIKCENIKDGKVIVGLRFTYEYKDSFRIKKIENSLLDFKTKQLKNGIPYSDDGSHFKHPDRDKYVTRIDKFSPNQIGFLISCPQFLADYGDFYASNSADNEKEATRIAKDVLYALLSNKPQLLNDYKLIDFDYYVYCQLKNGLLKLQKNDNDAGDDIVNSVEELEFSKS